MELQGKIIAALEPRTGESARGPWKVQSFVLETHEAYPRKMVFDVFGEDRLQRFAIQVGQEVSVSFDIDAHEYNGRWFNSIRAFDVRPVVASASNDAPFPTTQQPAPTDNAAAPATVAASQSAAPATQTTEAPTQESSDDDLPF